MEGMLGIGCVLLQRNALVIQYSIVTSVSIFDVTEVLHGVCHHLTTSSFFLFFFPFFFVNPSALDRMAMFQSIGVVVGMYASAVVLPLDWDRPWQVGRFK